MFPLRARRPQLPFLAALALTMVLLRLVLFDYGAFFSLVSVPNHDMYQGASLFATSMHSMRLTGELAWWNPVSFNGSAQYYLNLLSPLAPTMGHPVYIVWAELVFLLSLPGVAIPEYYQYLVITYVILPFLALLAFAWVCSLLFRSRSPIVLATAAYALSSIGLWNSAWFYFQEPGTMLFVVGAVLNVLKRPAPRSMILLLVAGLVQVASFNYWTLFNSWFVLIFLGVYAAFHPAAVRRALRQLLAILRRWPARSAALVAGWLAVAAVWGLVIVSTLKESPLYPREGQQGFDAYEATGRIDPTFALSRMFHPDLESVAPRPYDTFQTMHHVVYLGAFLLPLLLALPFSRWRRVERWLLVCAVAIGVICFAPPPIVWLWEHFPFMNRVRHLFVFYPTFLRLLVLLVACAVLDRIHSIRRPHSIRAAVTILVGSAVILLLGGRAFGPLQRLGGAPAALLLLVPAALVCLALFRPTRGSRAMLVGVLLAVALVDLATYFRLACRLDADFTAVYRKVQRPLPPDVTQVLRSPWGAFDPDNPHYLYYNMPVASHFWPINAFTPHQYVVESMDLDAKAWEGPFIGFHPGTATDWMTRHAPAALVNVPYRWRRRDYNGWVADVQVPESGWLSIAQLYDPSWRATMDGTPVEVRRASVVRSAFRADGGMRLLEMTYLPPARRLYWPASLALELGLAVLGLSWWRVGAWRSDPRSVSREKGRAERTSSPAAGSSGRSIPSGSGSRGRPRSAPPGVATSRPRQALSAPGSEWGL